MLKYDSDFITDEEVDTTDGILNALREERIFAAQIEGDGVFFLELCDRYFGVWLNKADMEKLIQELADLAAQIIAPTQASSVAISPANKDFTQATETIEGIPAKGLFLDKPYIRGYVFIDDFWTPMTWRWESGKYNAPDIEECRLDLKL